MPSSWGSKLEQKLNGLADTASKDSVQTLSNWIGFNRKRTSTITTILTRDLIDNKNNAKRQWMYWRLIHQVLLNSNEDEGKWKKLAELRVALGEALQPAMKQLGSSIAEELGLYLEEWEDKNVFGGPSLISQIRRLYQNRNNVATTTNKTAATKASVPAEDLSIQSSSTKAQLEVSGSSAQIKTESSKDDTTAETNANVGDASIDHSPHNGNTVYPGPDNNEEEATTKEEKEYEAQNGTKMSLTEDVPTKSPSPGKRNSFLNQQVDYDFESTGVPSGKVESREFLDPCKAITTLQIARDVRTSTAVEISTELTNLPADVLAACEDLKSGKVTELDTATTNEFSVRIPSNLIDLDIDEETSSLNTFQDIVQRQKKAREKLIYLLLKSRCQFGSVEAAGEFFKLEALSQKLKKRKELLSDALELEGVDTSEIVVNDSKSKREEFEEDLAPLTWYNPSESSKKQKVL